MKHLLLTTIAVVLVVGCGESQQSTPAPEAKPVEPVAEASQPEVPTAKAPDISIHRAARQGEIEGIKQHLAAGTDVNAKHDGRTPLHGAALHSRTEITELLIANDADVNSRDVFAVTPLHLAVLGGHKEIAELLIDAGANVNVKNKNGNTPLDTAHKAF
ncbi:ankyrin repeat domain-containing protein, partial [bacterium]|nr:ankyrin repeat domain-containing protein [bacterium]